MSEKRTLTLKVLILAVCSALFALPALAQNFYGSIVGTVTDTSGAPMEGATVTVINAGTADRSGLPNLRSGRVSRRQSDAR